MDTQNPDRAADADDLMVPAQTVQEMLASLQEAVVTADQDARRGLLKRVIAQLQEVLGGATAR